MPKTPHIAAMILAAGAAAAAGHAQTLTHVRVDTPRAPAVAGRLEQAGYDVVEGGVTPSSLELVASDEELWRLRAMGLTPAVIQRGRPFAEIQEERLAADRARLGPDAVPTGYRTLDQIIADMQAVATAYPAIAKVVDLTAKYGTPATANGRHLYAMKISSNVDLDQDKPSFLLVACHHAREIVTPVIAMNAIGQFTQKYATDPEIKELVDTYEIWVAPVWNPDGYSYVFTTDNTWRKNRRAVTGGTGIDQNRNYPLGWTAACDGSTMPSAADYKGPAVASEAETKTMMAFSIDRHFAKVLDYHSSGREVLWGYKCLDHPFESWLQAEAIALAGASSYGTANRVPSAEGEHEEWQMAARGCFTNLIETAASFQPSFTTAQQEADRVWPGVLYMLQRPITLSGHVTDAATGDPVSATIKLDGVAFSNGETNYSEPRFGRYHVFLPDGARTVRFQAAGYPDATVTITASKTAELVRDIKMGDMPPPPPPPPTCYADCDKSGKLDIADFTCFQNKFALSDAYANCNGDTQPGGEPRFDIADFTCYQNKFALGCP